MQEVKEYRVGYKLMEFCVFPAGVLARTGGFRNGAGQIWLDNVACTGRENRLTDCRANAFGVHNCVHGEDAGVLCPSERALLRHKHFTINHCHV